MKNEEMGRGDLQDLKPDHDLWKRVMLGPPHVRDRITWDNDALAAAVSGAERVDELDLIVKVSTIDDSLCAMTFPGDIRAVDPVIAVFSELGGPHHVFVHRDVLKECLDTETYAKIRKYLSGESE